MNKNFHDVGIVKSCAYGFRKKEGRDIIRLRGRVQIMENELECLGDEKGQDGHLAETFLKKYYS